MRIRILVCALVAMVVSGCDGSPLDIVSEVRISVFEPKLTVFAIRIGVDMAIMVDNPGNRAIGFSVCDVALQRRVEGRWEGASSGLFCLDRRTWVGPGERFSDMWRSSDPIARWEPPFGGEFRVAARIAGADGRTTVVFSEPFEMEPTLFDP